MCLEPGPACSFSIHYLPSCKLSSTQSMLTTVHGLGELGWLDCHKMWSQYICCYLCSQVSPSLLRPGLVHSLVAEPFLNGEGRTRSQIQTRPTFQCFRLMTNRKQEWCKSWMCYKTREHWHNSENAVLMVQNAQSCMMANSGSVQLELMAWAGHHLLLALSMEWYILTIKYPWYQNIIASVAHCIAPTKCMSPYNFNIITDTMLSNYLPYYFLFFFFFF